jgi:hypothetical protein
MYDPLRDAVALDASGRAVEPPFGGGSEFGHSLLSVFMFYSIRGITCGQGAWGELTDRRLRVSEGAFFYFGLRPYSPAGVHWAISTSNG